MTELLKGLTVVDTTLNLPGPAAGHILAALGARVIKVVPPTGDPVAAFPQLDTAINGNKERLVLDLKAEEDAQAFAELLTQADGVLVGLRHEALSKLGLDKDALMAQNPHLIYCHVTGFPVDSESTSRPGHDVTYLARSGLLTGLVPGVSNIPTQLADLTGALYAALLWLAALHRRNQTGHGVAIEVNLYESASVLAVVQQTAPNLAWILSGQAVCYRCYQTSDGMVAVGALEEKFFERLVGALGYPEWSRQGMTAAEPGNPVFDALVKEFAAKDTEMWVNFGIVHDVPIEPVRHDIELMPLTIPLRIL